MHDADDTYVCTPAGFGRKVGCDHATWNMRAVSLNTWDDTRSVHMMKWKTRSQSAVKDVHSRHGRQWKLGTSNLGNVAWHDFAST